MNENNREYRLKLLSSISNWLAGIEHEGKDGHLFHGSLVTMVFHQISGSHRARCQIMFSEAERLYNTLLRHVIHHPNRQSSLSKWPITVMVPDYPVRKRRPGSSVLTVTDVSLNDGLHLHGLALIRIGTRLRQTLGMHIKSNYKEYIRPGFPLRRIYVRRIYVRPIRHSLENVADYCFKTLKRRDLDLDDLLILPKARSEMVDLSQQIRWFGIRRPPA